LSPRGRVRSRFFWVQPGEPSYSGHLEPSERFDPPDLDLDRALLESYFARLGGGTPAEIGNYHQETPVDESIRARAIPASVLVPIVEHTDGLYVLLTRRSEEISYPGQVCFPGGRADPGDASPEATALREAHEEIDLNPESVRILGRLGDYYTHSAFRITPVVGLVRPPLDLTPSPREVTEILEVPLRVLTRAKSYRIWRKVPEREQAFYALEHGEVQVTGPTVCVAMGFYEALALWVSSAS
jgi:8-oxo-dGTP pyrophosphatase MutT (NUDIX family)